MVGIAIINYKTYQKTLECIESIRKTTNLPYKIYLLDNGSGNESAEILSHAFQDSSDVECIISEENHGYARGNNICIQRMRTDGCDIGIISNNDIICDLYSIDTLVQDMKNNPNYILIGPKIVDPNGKFQKSIKKKEYGRVEYLHKSTYLSNFHKKAIQKEINEASRISELESVSWVSGAFFIFDIAKMEQIGDFDPATFLFFEEYILGSKSKRKNFLLGYDPRVKVFHYHAFSTGGGVNIVSKIAADRSEQYFFKHYTDVSKLFLFILRMIRLFEVLFTFGKKKDIESIKKYLDERKLPLSQ